MRFAHELRGNAKTELPRELIFVDTETLPVDIGHGTERHYLWFGQALYVRIRDRRGRRDIQETWFEFDKPSAFWDWAESRSRSRTKLLIFAHNWNFDAGILETETQLKRRGWKTHKYINGKPPFILEVRRNHHTMALVDSLNYFQSSLDALGDSIGIPKLEMPDTDAPFECWREYCKRDVTVLKEAILRFRSFVEAEDLGNFRQTLASQAFNAFRHKYYRGGIFIHDDERTLELERRGYFGGRVECFFIGEKREKLYYLDVNSLYPSMMADNEYPVKLVKRRRNVEPEALAEAIQEHSVVARVRIETETPAFPKRHDNRLVFPVGSFETTLCTPELEQALSMGAIKSVSVLAMYERTRIFEDYVTELYAKRRQYESEENPSFAYMCKIMLNSLYGKFGQRGAVWDEVDYDLPTDDMTEWLEGDEFGNVSKYRVRLGVVQRQNRDSEARESFPAIAAHVTSYGRMHMWRLMVQAGLENVYYTDTDSLVINEHGFRRLTREIHQSVLGKLAVEATAEAAIFHGPKDYDFGGKVRMKGIRRNADQVGPSTWEQDKFNSWDAHLKRGQDGFIDIDRVRKTLKREYRKGTVHSDGSVTPIRLGDDTAGLDAHILEALNRL